MRRARLLIGLTALATLAGGLTVHAPALAGGSAGVVRTIAAAGTARLSPAVTGTDAIQWPEFPGGQAAEEGVGTARPFDDPGASVNRSLSAGRTAPGVAVQAGKKAKSNPELVLSFDGLNHRDQRLANRGNQFSVEPPDQGLCVGGGFVLETVNDVLRVYDRTGTPLSGVTDLNTFYGYPAAINRSTFTFGPFVTDPSCLFDADTGRWFHLVLTLDVDPATGAFLGSNHLDLAVSQTGDPRGAWTVYRIPAQDDGTQGTPDHHCSPGPGSENATNPRACLGDYPHMGADRYGIYITTNEYDLFGPSFHAAQVYALPKQTLASLAPTVPVVQFDTVGAVAGNPGFTVFPASTPPGGPYASGAGGTEYFLSSMAAEEANNTTGVDHRIAVWALTNTSSLATPNLALALQNVIVDVGEYSIPPKADQKPGPFPLGECINDTSIVIPGLGTGCWRLFFAPSDEPAHDEVLSHLDSSDTRMHQVVYAQGLLYGALDTAVLVGGEVKAGVAWYIVRPSVSAGSVSAAVTKQGYLALANNNLIYPAIAVTRSGRGAMAFTVVGEDFYPSAGYAAIDPLLGAGAVHIAKAGLGPHDGFTAYKAFVGSPPRTRWGDYGAAVSDGKSIWIASEYIGQTCTLAQYLSPPIGSCGGTRTSLANWGTRISRLIP